MQLLTEQARFLSARTGTLAMQATCKVASAVYVSRLRNT